MTRADRILAGLANGPAFLSALLPDVPSHKRTPSAATLRKRGLIRRNARVVLDGQWQVRWERVPQ